MLAFPTFKLAQFAAAGQWLLLAVGACITGTALWLILEAGLALRRFRAGGQEPMPLDIPLSDDRG